MVYGKWNATTMNNGTGNLKINGYLLQSVKNVEANYGNWLQSIKEV